MKDRGDSVAELSAAPIELGRPFCYRCHKPRVTCICRLVSRVQNRTPVWIVQHPREQFHPIGTARIARLGLEQVEVDVRHRDRTGPPRGFPEGAALLYPGKTARDLSTLGQCPPKALVLLDGTWPHARRLFRDNPWLHGLERYGLVPPEPSRYRIRKEPAPQCVSTIESVVYALSLIEPDTEGLDGLLTAFHGMIDDQICIIRSRATGRRQAVKRRRHLLGAERERLVIAEAEAISIAGDPERRRELVHWVAVRAATGEVFERVVKPKNEPKPSHLFHMGLTDEELSEGVEAAELARDWRAFVNERDVIVAWTESSLEARPVDGGLATRVLKSAYCNVRRGSRGTLEQMIAAEGLDPEPLAVRGRAGRRLSAALAMYELLRS